jgi:beta-glucosidase
VKSIAVIGGHADVGVLSGGGSTQVRPVGGPALEIRVKKGPAAAFARRTYHPSAPLNALKERFPVARIDYADGSDIAAAQALARDADMAIVFGEQWRTEAQDLASLKLDGGDDELIAAVATANPKTIVVLQTGGAVLMPWLDKVDAVLLAWYPGQRGGEAIADVLSGAINPSGRLPLTFPAAEEQLPRPKLDGIDDDRLNANASYAVLKNAPPFDIDYDIDGANVGYRWYELRNHQPLFPFGFGLSYTRFEYSKLRVSGGKTMTVRARVSNRGDRAGIATPQFYASIASHGQPPVPRLIGWDRVLLQPGESRDVKVTVDPRLLAEFDTTLPGWRVHGGKVQVVVGDHAADKGLAVDASIAARILKP